MKRASKKLAFVMALLLVMSVMSVTTAAAVGGVTAITIKGYALDGASGRQELPPGESTQEAAIENTVEVTLPYATLASSANKLVIVAGTIGNVKIAVNPDESGTVTIGGGADSLAADTSILEPNTVIWIQDGTSGDAKYIRILVRQASSSGVGGTIVGGSTVVNSYLNVILPLSLDFGIDPLGIGDVIEDGQITSMNYHVANKSNAPVKVTFTITAEGRSDVELVSSAAELNNDVAHSGTKHAFFAAVGASALTASPTDIVPTFSGVGSTRNGEWIYDTSVVGTTIPFPASASGSDQGVEMSFVLAPATGNPLNSLAANNKGLSAFSFYGQVDTYAKWIDNDLTVVGVYQLQGLKTSDYATESARSVGLNVLRN